MREKIARFSIYMASKGLNDNQVTVQCGLSQGLIGQARTGKSDLGNKTINKILNVYQDLNKTWLLTGDGEMLKGGGNVSIANSPQSVGNNTGSVVYNNHHTRGQTDGSDTSLKPLIPPAISKQPNLDVFELIKNKRLQDTTYYNTFNGFTAYDMYYEVKQDAMLPDYKPGDVLALSAMQGDGTIINGSPMLIDTYSVGFVFRLVYNRGEHYECRVSNKNSHYEDTDIPKSDVIRLYRVVGMLRTGM